MFTIGVVSLNVAFVVPRGSSSKPDVRPGTRLTMLPAASETGRQQKRPSGSGYTGALTNVRKPSLRYFGSTTDSSCAQVTTVPSNSVAGPFGMR